MEQIDLLYRESTSTFFLSHFLFFFPFFVDRFFFFDVVIGSDKYRKEMLERGETYLTNLEHQKEVCSFFYYLIFYSRALMMRFFFSVRRFISMILRKKPKVHRYPLIDFSK